MTSLSRRNFLLGLGAVVALHDLPKQLMAPRKIIERAVTVTAPNAYQSYCGQDPYITALWAALYELDPHMRVSIDHKNHAFHLTTCAPVDLVTDVLWKYKPVGVLATINGRQADFTRNYTEAWERWEVRA
jgi:hypothetical protein